MKSLLKAVAVAAVFAVPAVSFAQQQQPQQAPTRADVRAQLVQLRAAGYDPMDWMNYPQNLQAAQAKVAAQNATAYGPAANGTSQTGQ